MITTVLFVILAALLLSVILDAWPSPNLGRALLIVLVALLLLWLFTGYGTGRAL